MRSGESLPPTHRTAEGEGGGGAHSKEAVASLEPGARIGNTLIALSHLLFPQGVEEGGEGAK